MPGMGSGFTCRSTAHGANRNRTKPQSQPHSHPTRVLLRWIRGGEVCVGAPPSVRTGQAHTRTRGGCSYNKYPNSHPARVLLQQIREFAPGAGAPTKREGVERLPLTSPAHHLQRHPIPGRVAPAVLLHTRSYCFLLLDHSLHGNRFNLTPLLYSQMKATRESSEAIDFATVSGLRLWPFKPSRRLFP